MEQYLELYQQWRKTALDETVCQSLKAMENNEEEIKNAFYKNLTFGTGGMRSVMSAGTNRINVYTVQRATIGFARYLLAHGKDSCAVTYDSRLNSKRFAEVTAATLASYGIKTYLTKTCMPTPFLSFLVRRNKCGGGVNVTASHNPSEYNGYKVYDEHGCQLTDKAANEVTEFIDNTAVFCDPLAKLNDYLGGAAQYADDAAEEEYKQCVLAESLNSAEGIKVAYTPLNGVGYKIVPDVLRRVGVTDIVVVAEQGYPDGNFPTCPSPNPEKSEALTSVIDLAKMEKADIVIATDPDSDRLGSAVLHNGEYVLLSGNDVGALLCDYVLSSRKQKGDLPANPIVVKTIVTTSLIDAIAEKYGAQVENVLTGFKYIGDIINKLEEKGEQNRYVFGFEESCGYLKGSYVRDKDGVVASMLIAECAAFNKCLGFTLVDRLNKLYEEFGAFYQRTVSYRFDGGSAGEECKNARLQKLRQNPPAEIGGHAVADVCDFLSQSKYNLPKSNVLRYTLDNGSQLIVRPSGTEPLVKCYSIIRGDKSLLDAAKQFTDGLFN